MSCLVHRSRVRFYNKNRCDVSDFSFSVHIFVTLLYTCGIFYTSITPPKYH